MTGKPVNWMCVQAMNLNFRATVMHEWRKFVRARARDARNKHLHTDMWRRHELNNALEIIHRRKWQYLNIQFCRAGRKTLILMKLKDANKFKQFLLAYIPMDLFGKLNRTAIFSVRDQEIARFLDLWSRALFMHVYASLSARPVFSHHSSILAILLRCPQDFSCSSRPQTLKQTKIHKNSTSHESACLQHKLYIQCLSKHPRKKSRKISIKRLAVCYPR